MKPSQLIKTQKVWHTCIWQKVMLTPFQLIKVHLYSISHPREPQSPGPDIVILYPETSHQIKTFWTTPYQCLVTG
jgi:hypothetical protein